MKAGIVSVVAALCLITIGFYTLIEGYLVMHRAVAQAAAVPRTSPPAEVAQIAPNSLFAHTDLQHGCELWYGDDNNGEPRAVVTCPHPLIPSCSYQSNNQKLSL